jgi:hypothetical protein
VVAHQERLSDAFEMLPNAGICPLEAASVEGDLVWSDPEDEATE